MTLKVTANFMHVPKGGAWGGSCPPEITPCHSAATPVLDNLVTNIYIKITIYNGKSNSIKKHRGSCRRLKQTVGGKKKKSLKLYTTFNIKLIKCSEPGCKLCH